MAKSLKETKTEKNLLIFFAGESHAILHQQQKKKVMGWSFLQADHNQQESLFPLISAGSPYGRM